MRHFFAWVLVGSAAIWVVAFVAAPGQLAAGSPLAAWLYEACGFICHQRPERSFTIGGIPMPVCGRCLGLYASGAVGALFAGIRVPRLQPPAELDSRAARTWLLVAAMPTAATLLIEWSGLLQPGSTGRALAAVPLGGLAGWLLVRTIHGGRANMRTHHVRYDARETCP